MRAPSVFSLAGEQGVCLNHSLDTPQLGGQAWPQAARGRRRWQSSTANAGSWSDDSRSRQRSSRGSRRRQISQVRPAKLCPATAAEPGPGSAISARTQNESSNAPESKNDPGSVPSCSGSRRELAGSIPAAPIKAAANKQRSVRSRGAGERFPRYRAHLGESVARRGLREPAASRGVLSQIVHLSSADRLGRAPASASKGERRPWMCSALVIVWTGGALVMSTSGDHEPRLPSRRAAARWGQNGLAVQSALDDEP